MKRRTLFLGGATALATGAGVLAAGFARMGSSADYREAMKLMRAPLARDPALPELVRYATLAANGHNTQPWRFGIQDRTIRMLPDFSRRTPVVDPDDHHLYVSLGCAAENLMLAASARGWRTEPHFEPANGGSLVFDLDRAPESNTPLQDAIPHRQSTRADYDGRPVPAADLTTLEINSRVPGVDLILVTDRARINRVRDLVIAGNDVQMADRAFVAELRHWMRFNPRAALDPGDGIYSAASGNPILPSWLGSRMFDLVFRAEPENKKYARQLDTSAGVVVFLAQRADPESWIRVGRACQRFALQATALGLKHAFINQPVEVPPLRPELAALVGIRDRRPDIVMRFGYGPTLTMSPRRPLGAVLKT